MLKIEGGRSRLYQWDVDQRLEVDNDSILEVQYDNAVTSPALVCEVYEENGRRYANIPNILLQQPWAIQAYGCCGLRVRDVITCQVIRRERPDDYVYTETEVRRYKDLEARVRTLEQNGPGEGESCEGKLDENLGTENAGRLLYVDADGLIVPLTLGAGLEIRDGVLTVTNARAVSAICGEALCGEVICGEE